MSRQQPRSLHVVGQYQSAFGAMLRQRRLSEGLTQADLAARFGVRQQTIGAWERGTLRPQRRFYPELADYLGVRGVEGVLSLMETDGASPSTPSGSSRLSTEDTVATAPDWGRVVADLTAAVGERVKQGPLSRHEATLFTDLLDYAARQREGDT